MTEEIRPAGEPEEVAASVPSPPEPAADLPPAPTDGGNASLLALIDRLGGLLERSDLSELEVEAGETSLILRKPVAVPPLTSGAAAAAAATREGPARGRSALRLAPTWT